jgi:hypothetical protein
MLEPSSFTLAPAIGFPKLFFTTPSIDCANALAGRSAATMTAIDETLNIFFLQIVML